MANNSYYWPAQCLKASFGCFGVGGVLCGLLMALERSGINFREHWLLGFIQRIGGSWTVGGIACALGVFLLAMAVIGAKQNEDAKDLVAGEEHANSASKEEIAGH
jgi:hypothetical protein